MIAVSNDCKNACNSDTLKYKEYIVINNQTIEIRGKLSATAFNDKNFIGTFNLKSLTFETENDIDFKEKEFEYYKQVNNESFKIGTFITTEVEDSDTNELVKVVAMDYGLKFATPYATALDYDSGNITLQNVFNEIIENVNVDLATDSQPLVNGSFIVDSNQFVNSEVYGDVISAIASINGMFAVITENDELKLMTKNQIGREESTININLMPDNFDYISFPEWINEHHTGEEGDLDNYFLISNDIPYNINTDYDTKANIQMQTKKFYTLTTLGDIWDDEWNSDFDTPEEIELEKQKQKYIYQKDDFYLTSETADINPTVFPEDYAILIYDSNRNLCGFMATEEQFNSLGDNTKTFLYYPYALTFFENNGMNNDLNIYSIHEGMIKYFANQGLDYEEEYEYASEEEKEFLDRTLEDATYINFFTDIKVINNDTIPLQYTLNIEKFNAWKEKNNIEFLWQIQNAIGFMPYFELNELFQHYIIPAEDYEIIEDYTELDDKRDTRPITIVQLGMSQVQGVEVQARWEEGIQQYGENYLILNDNPFAYTMGKRQELVNNILEQVKGLGYSSFESKFSFKPYLQIGDTIKFKNKNGDLIDSIILKLDTDYENITLSAPSIADATVDYVVNDTEQIARRAEVIANQATGEVQIITNQVRDIGNTVESNYQQMTENFNNYYTIDQTNEMIINAQSGLTNSFSESGGNNIFRNTGLWFKDNNGYEYWQGDADRISEDNAVNNNAILLKTGSFSQEQDVPNGNYSINFYYQKLVQFADVKVKINDVEYELDSHDVKLFYTGEQNSETLEYITQPIVVSTKKIKIEFISDTDGAVKVYDLMCNKGSARLVYSQNENETTTDTVNISKGITITSTNMETIFRANADGIRILTLTGNVVAYFTDKGLSTKELIVENEAQIVKTLWQEVGDQTWITRI